MLHFFKGLWISLKLLPGDLTQVQKNFSHLVDRSTAIARKMGFPEIILPGKKLWLDSPVLPPLLLLTGQRRQHKIPRDISLPASNGVETVGNTYRVAVPCTNLPVYKPEITRRNVTQNFLFPLFLYVPHKPL